MPLFLGSVIRNIFLCITRAVAVLLAALRHPEHLRWCQRKGLALAPRRDLNAHGHDDVLEIFAIWQRNQRGTIAIRQANADHVLAHIGLTRPLGR